MTDGEKHAIRLLAKVTFLPASRDKRHAYFLIDLLVNSPGRGLSSYQSSKLMQLVHKYRRQHGECNCLDCFNEAAAKDNPAQVKLFEEWKEVGR